MAGRCVEKFLLSGIFERASGLIDNMASWKCALGMGLLVREVVGITVEYVVRCCGGGLLEGMLMIVGACLRRRDEAIRWLIRVG